MRSGVKAVLIPERIVLLYSLALALWDVLAAKVSRPFNRISLCHSHDDTYNALYRLMSHLTITVLACERGFLLVERDSTIVQSIVKRKTKEPQADTHHALKNRELVKIIFILWVKVSAEQDSISTGKLWQIITVFLYYTVIHKIGTPLYFYNNFFKC